MMKKAILSCLMVKVILSIILDLTFLSNFSFSLQLGVNGVAYSNIITGFVNAILGVLFLVTKLSPSLQHLKKLWEFAWLKTWFLWIRPNVHEPDLHVGYSMLLEPGTVCF